MMDTDAGKAHLLTVLKREGKHDEFMRFLKRGKQKKALAIAEAVIAEHRAEFDNVMEREA